MITDEQKPKSYSSTEMALAVLVERISNLPDDDRNDLFDLSKAFYSSDPEESKSAAEAMREILEPPRTKPDSVSKLVPGSKKEELQKWIDYISKKISSCRKEASMTQKELAEKSGIPQPHISRLESGQHSPSAKTIKALAKAMGLLPGDLDPSLVD